MNWAPWMLIVVMLTGCSLLKPGRVDIEGRRVAEVVRHLDLPTPPEGRADVPARDEVLARYRDLAGRVDDPELGARIARRTVELETARINERLASGEPVDVTPVVAELSAVIQAESHSALRYQLAQLLELQGESARVRDELSLIIEAEGVSSRGLEARFRRAELAFIEGSYDSAIGDYSAVAESDTAYSMHARYMFGWTAFKLARHSEALDALLDTISILEANELARVQNELLADTERALVLTLDYLEGPASLAAAMAQRRQPAWQARAYRALGGWYRDKERFSDSARTWQTFLDENPLDAEAPAIVLQVIETHREAGFVQEIPVWERRFVDSFERDSQFHAMHGGLGNEEARHLRAFFDRLIAGAHAAAQSRGGAADYLAAANLYARWLDNFPGDPEAAEKHYLMAESLLDAGETRPAVSAFADVAALYPASSLAREAAYAVMTGLSDIAASRDELLLEERTEAAWRFAETYSADSRASAVLADAASLLFDSGQWLAASTFAERALALGKLGEGEKSARLLVAHSRFELGHFDVASGYYRSLLAASPADEALRARLLATVFEQANQREAAGDLAAAIDLFESLSTIDPDSELAIDAQFDVASMIEAAGDASGAAARLEAFRHAHPTHPATPGIPMRLVALYETLGRPAAAARELLAIHDRGIAAADVRRQALFRAGELMLEDRDTEGAIDTFRRYAHGYETPVPLRLEAMDHMDRLYQQTGETDKRLFWLRKKLATVAGLGSEDKDARALALAADAALVLAQADRDEFESVSLTLPLASSLPRKQSAMKRALAGYTQAAAFQVNEVVSAATLEMANLYTSLASSLMNASRPEGLNDLEQSQYELLLEEQAFPFEEKAIELHEANLRRGWRSGFDDSIGQSLDALRKMMPGRFERPTMEVAHARTLY